MGSPPSPPTESSPGGNSYQISVETLHFVVLLATPLSSMRMLHFMAIEELIIYYTR